MNTPILVQFQISGYDGPVTMNNAQTSFEVRVNGKPTAFNFWTFATSRNSATVTLRLNWPLEDGAKVEVTLR
jgi:hypothetical protein